MPRSSGFWDDPKLGEYRLQELMSAPERGESWAHLARRLGCKRNVILGKANRKGLLRNGEPPGSASKAEAERRKRTIGTGDKRLLTGEQRPLTAERREKRGGWRDTAVLTAKPQELTRELELAADGDPEPIIIQGRRLNTMDASDRVCRWPIGDPLKPDFHICGHRPAPGSAYCYHHFRRSREPASKQQSQNKAITGIALKAASL